MEQTKPSGVPCCEPQAREICPAATSSRPPAPRLLNRATLVAAGRHLIRWRTLTFYGAFLPEDGPQNYAAQTLAEARKIREQLHPVDVIYSWRVYKTALSQAPSSTPSSTPSNTNPRAEISRGGILHGAKRKWCRQASQLQLPLQSYENAATSAGASPSPPSRPSPCSNATTTVDDTLEDVFVKAAEELHVSRALLEMAFKCYEYHLAHKRRLFMTVDDLLENLQHDLLGEILMIDMDDFAPREGDAPGEHLRLRRITSGMSFKCPSSDEEHAVSKASFDEYSRRKLLGELYPCMLMAIFRCKSTYFVRLSPQNPKPLCDCGPDNKRCGWCVLMPRRYKKGKRRAPDWKSWRIKWQLTEAEAWKYGERKGCFKLNQRQPAIEL